MKHVAFLHDHVLGAGGAENHILSLIRCLRGELRFSLIARTTPQFRARAEELGARVFDQPAHRPLSPLWVAGLVRTIRAERIDLLHPQGAIAATPGRIAARLAGIPALVTFHFPASRYHGTRRTARALLGRALYVAVDRWLNHLLPWPLIYVSRTYRTEEVRAGRAPDNRAVFIPNGVDLSAYAPPLEPRANPLLTVLFVGRLAAQKGGDVLLNALEMLPPGLPPWECLIAGEGPLRAELEAQARGMSASVRPRVRFLGFRADVNRLLAVADVFVLPSRSEAASIALIEAMATGLPCVVTAVGDSAEMVLGGAGGPAGAAVGPDDAAALARELARLLADEPLRRRMSAAARQAARLYDERETARRVLEIYHALLEL